VTSKQPDTDSQLRSKDTEPTGSARTASASHLEGGQQLVCPLGLAEPPSRIIKLICNHLPGTLKQQAVVCAVLTSWTFFCVFQALNKLCIMYNPASPGQDVHEGQTQTVLYLPQARCCTYRLLLLQSSAETVRLYHVSSGQTILHLDMPSRASVVKRSSLISSIASASLAEGRLLLDLPSRLRTTVA
jgi:hypothetical protein